MSNTLPVKKITVLVNTGNTDTVYFSLDASTPYPNMGYEANAKMDARSGYGVEWVRQTFGRDPDEIIDLKKV